MDDLPIPGTKKPKVTTGISKSKKSTSPGGTTRIEGGGTPPISPEIIAEGETSQTSTIPPVEIDRVDSKVKTPEIKTPRRIQEIKINVAEQSALVVLALLDGLASMVFGPSAAMTPEEREVLSAPLARMLERLELTQSAALKTWADPALFVMGLIAWVSRITRERAKQKPKPIPEETDLTPEPEKPRAGHPVMKEEVDMGVVLKAGPNITQNMKNTTMGVAK